MAMWAESENACFCNRMFMTLQKNAWYSWEVDTLLSPMWALNGSIAAHVRQPACHATSTTCKNDYHSSWSHNYRLLSENVKFENKTRGELCFEA